MNAIKEWSLRNKQILAGVGTVISIPIMLVGGTLMMTPIEFSSSLLINFGGAAILAGGTMLLNAFISVADMLKGGSGETLLDHIIKEIKK